MSNRPKKKKNLHFGKSAAKPSTAPTFAKLPSPPKVQAGQENSLYSLFPDDPELANALGSFVGALEATGPLATLVRIPHESAKHAECFLNVLKVIDQEGGHPSWGWYFIPMTPLNNKSIRYLVAVHHCVHVTKETKRYVDITPFEGEHQPLTWDGKLVFLVDDNARPKYVQGESPVPLPNSFFPITDIPENWAFTEQMNQKARQRFDQEFNEKKRD